MTSKITVDKPGSFLLLNGDEAVARGAIEASLKVAAAYPGNPFYGNSGDIIFCC